MKIEERYARWLFCEGRPLPRHRLWRFFLVLAAAWLLLGVFSQTRIHYVFSAVWLFIAYAHFFKSGVHTMIENDRTKEVAPVPEGFSGLPEIEE